MSERKDSKSRRNYLVKCSCPNCTQESEHSFSRVQKGALLICPHCNKVFQTNLGNDSNLLVVFYVQIMPDDFVMQLHRF
ncbi:Permease, cytosine/purine, uracil, thiamine, allantoin family [Escherichia coli]|nr:Permease, cytosine/purine, uracil, thiamine, allantoin family [Escherichia coli]